MRPKRSTTSRRSILLFVVPRLANLVARARKRAVAATGVILLALGLLSMHGLTLPDGRSGSQRTERLMAAMARPAIGHEPAADQGSMGKHDSNQCVATLANERLPRPQQMSTTVEAALGSANGVPPAGFLRLRDPPSERDRLSLVGVLRR